MYFSFSAALIRFRKQSVKDGRTDVWIKYMHIYNNGLYLICEDYSVRRQRELPVPSQLKQNCWEAT